MNKSQEAILEVKHLKKFFPIRAGLLLKHVGDVRALDDVSLCVARGQTLGLVGESGCGKSTLGRTIIRLYDPTAGSVIFQGKDVTHAKGQDLLDLRRGMQMVFQDPYASLNPRHTVGHILSEPLHIFNVGNASDRAARVADLMKKVGLNPSYTNRYPHEFSGGQRQRISIARAIALNPALVIADEPVSALDVSIRAQVLNLMQDLQQDLGLTYIFVSHDLSVIEHICDTIAVMYLGKIVELASREALFRNPLHPYTRALLAAVPIVGRGKQEKTKVLAGDVPSPIAPPPGCAFHPRCEFAKESCKRDIPALQSVAGDKGHEVACWLHV